MRILRSSTCASRWAPPRSSRHWPLAPWKRRLQAVWRQRTRRTGASRSTHQIALDLPPARVMSCALAAAAAANPLRAVALAQVATACAAARRRSSLGRAVGVPARSVAEQPSCCKSFLRRLWACLWWSTGRRSASRRLGSGEPSTARGGADAAIVPVRVWQLSGSRFLG